jgi:ubiquinone/menaquinone biosynthesis C-methylase UbiE
MASKFGRDLDWNTGTRKDFYAYYEKESMSIEANTRFGAIRSTLLRLIAQPQLELNIADLGCGAGTQCRMWAEQGHHVFGVDINAALISLARERATQAELDICFDVASVTALPWPDNSMDLCIAVELLEHVSNWQGCLSEMIRVLKPGGALFLSTSNRLCPLQEEYVLPMYSWYPSFIKRYVEHLAFTTRPELAGNAIYPAVNWFTYYELRRHLESLGFSCLDRFDMIDTMRQGKLGNAVVGLIKKLPALRFLGHVSTSYTVLLASRQLPK